ncbi:MAG: hypothetical protein H6751_03485 [Candidatus Omnitrophica bacterium]|nr:hypothetical protein [Candidatus Omnitrophota bacterium]
MTEKGFRRNTVDISGVLVSVMLSSSLCFGFLPFQVDCECRITQTSPSQSPAKTETPKSIVKQEASRDEQTAELIDSVLSSLENRDRATFEKTMAPDSGRETVWKVLARPNRPIRGSQIVALDDSALYLTLNIEDDEGVKERTFELKTAKVGDELVVSDWVYLRQ